MTKTEQRCLIAEKIRQLEVDELRSYDKYQEACETKNIAKMTTSQKKWLAAFDRLLKAEMKWLKLESVPVRKVGPVLSRMFYYFRIEIADLLDQLSPKLVGSPAVDIRAILERELVDRIHWHLRAWEAIVERHEET